MGVLLKKALIPLGGLGTRLYPLTVETSKAIVRFLNRPLIEFAIVHLARQGINEFYMGVSGYYNYKEVYDYLGEGLKLRAKYGLQDVRIRYQPNEESLGSAHSVCIIMEYYDIREPVLVVQGDLLFSIDIAELWNFHQRVDAFMTIVIKELESGELHHYGVAELDESMRIKRFVEKPKRPEEAPSRYINTGIYVLSSSFREFMNSEEALALKQKGMMDFGQHIIPLAIQKTNSVYAYILKGYWFDVGTPEKFLEASLFMLSALPLEDLEAYELVKGVLVQGKSKESRMLHQEILRKILDKTITVEGNVLIGRHVKIGDGAFLAHAVIDNYTIIGNRVEVSYSVVMDRCKIGEGAKLHRSIIGRHVRIGRNSKISGSVIGDDVVVGDNVELINVKVWPHKEVPSNARLENVIIK